MGKMHDRCTAAFFRPWKPSHKTSTIPAIKVANWTDPSAPEVERNDDGTPKRVMGVHNILNELTKYYTALFAPKKTNPEAKRICLNTLKQGNRVLPPTAAKCDARITKEEIEREMEWLPNGKSPGPDRLPNKFYKTFSKFLAPILTDVINESAIRGKLPHSCLQGIISVLYKKGDRDDPRNYRPITLLNNDFKIITKTLVRRMTDAVKQFVSREQNGFVPGGFLPENVMLLKLIQAYLEDKDEDGMMIFLDMEKAFDRSDWDYMIDAMRAVGFGEKQKDSWLATTNG